MEIATFTGGIFDTNCFYLKDSGVLIDAPSDCAEWLKRTKRKVKMLLITHGHIDHVADAARVQREHQCQVGYHSDGVAMLTEPGFFRRFGFDFEVEPVRADFSIEETPSCNFSGIEFQVLFVPGHCPGSICFFSKTERILFGGDVLFAGSIGRTDLPGGDHALLISGIKNKVLPLGDDVRVLSGHGPVTTIGEERKTNPFLS
jgi:hydroxyacylglutathione hydrolase